MQKNVSGKMNKNVSGEKAILTAERVSRYISILHLLPQFKRREKKVRYMNRVEVMCPLLSTKLIMKTIPWLKGLQTGWGLEWVWTQILEQKNIAVLDFIEVEHTRQISFKKEKYKNLKMHPKKEWANLKKRYIRKMKPKIIFPDKFIQKKIISFAK